MTTSAGISMPLSHLAEQRALPRTLGAKALLHAKDGQADEAWDTALTQQFADALRTEPIIVSQLVRGSRSAWRAPPSSEDCVRRRSPASRDARPSGVARRIRRHRPSDHGRRRRAIALWRKVTRSVCQGNSLRDTLDEDDYGRHHPRDCCSFACRVQPALPSGWTTPPTCG